MPATSASKNSNGETISLSSNCTRCKAIRSEDRLGAKRAEVLIYVLGYSLTIISIILIIVVAMYQTRNI